MSEAFLINTWTFVGIRGGNKKGLAERPALWFVALTGMSIISERRRGGSAPTVRRRARPDR